MSKAEQHAELNEAGFARLSEKIEGIIGDDKFSNFQLTIKKRDESQHQWVTCKVLSDPQISLNAVGRLWGGGEYQGILNYVYNNPETGERKSQIQTFKFNLSNFWTRVMNREIDENGNPLEEDEEIETNPVSTGTEIVNGLRSLIQDVMPIITTFIQSRGNGNGNQEILAQMLTAQQQNSNNLMQLLIAKQDKSSDLLLEGVRQGMGLNADIQEPPSAVEKVLDLVSNNFDTIVGAMENKNTGMIEMAKNQPDVKQAMATTETAKQTAQGIRNMFVKKLGEEKGNNLTNQIITGFGHDPEQLK